nr:glycerophosphodiester phosphodiesterase family protein [Geminicoccus roseus]
MACLLPPLAALAQEAAEPVVELGPRPFYLADRLEDGELKDRLGQCRGPFQKSDFSIGHRGAPLMFPEHTRESYLAAARMGAGVLECDVAFTADRELVCRHAQCDLHTTTNILAVPELAAKCSEPFTPADPATGTPASAKCCTSDLTLAEFQTLEGKMDSEDKQAADVLSYMQSTAPWRTDLYVPGQLMTHAESIELFKELGVKATPELKAPEVAMPYEGDYSQEDYAQALIDAYRQAGVPPSDVFPQSFNLDDVLYWLKAEPEYGAQAVYLDGRNEDDPAFDSNDPSTWKPGMQELADQGVRILAPPLWMLLTLDDGGKIVPSAYAREAKAAGLELITWSLERSGPLAGGGGGYYRTVTAAIDDDSDMLVALDVLAREVGVRGVFSDWPATTTFYANCMGMTEGSAGAN